MRHLFLLVAGALLFAAPLRLEASDAADFDAGQIEFFEANIRPVLVEQCYACHNSSDLAEGDLTLDHRDGVLTGSAYGPIIDLEQPGESRLLAVLRHEIDGMEMPQDGAKLNNETIAAFEQWIRQGLPDPRSDPPGEAELQAAVSWEAKLAERKKWWSFQPIVAVEPPAVSGPAWMLRPIDRFVKHRLDSAGLEPVEAADSQTLIRRAYFALIGLPPTVEELAHWREKLKVANDHDAAFAELVDHLLDSPHFGERWARHWLDWIRYAESHGSEGDPRITNAWHYRDYLIRALNADVPYDQLVREHLAGDLLEQPRINAELGINESIIGTAHWRMVFHGFAPTDALDERVRFTDDQINAFSKAFLGLTVSCARCHDHKFDAISQADYYALYGVLASCRPGRNVIDLPQRVELHQERLTNLKPDISAAVVEDWLEDVDQLAQRLSSENAKWREAQGENDPLHELYRLNETMKAGSSFSEAWEDIAADYAEEEPNGDSEGVLNRWDLTQIGDYHTWYRHGAGLPQQPQPAGGFSVAATGDAALTGVYPAGVYSHLLSAKHPARLTSPDFHLDDGCELWLRVIGDGAAMVRYVVQDYPRNGTVYPVPNLKNHWHWQRFDLTYWTGDDIHIELTTAQDAPLLTKDNERSWFGVREVVLARKGAFDPSKFEIRPLAPLFRSSSRQPPRDWDEFADFIQATAAKALKAWKRGSATDEQAILLDALMKSGLLAGDIASLETAASLIEAYRRLEVGFPAPTRVPGLEETAATDQPLFVRGDHKRPGELVPRRFLEAIDDAPYGDADSGRRQLAEDLLREDNPLTRRVIVNRVWRHLFGEGLVRTPDNFGRLGEPPTHPKLLDYLAARFAEEGWSLKELIREMVASRTWRLSSRPTPAASEQDAKNRLLSHANVRRLEAEAIRDSLLAVSGRLDDALYGKPVAGDVHRRSVYVRVIRNSLDPFLRTFDFPEPFSTTGRRAATNVPAQSLFLMNDPFIAELAASWAQRVAADDHLMSDRQRVVAMFTAATAKEPNELEIENLLEYVHVVRNSFQDRFEERSELERQIASERRALVTLLQPIRQKLLADVDDVTAVEALPAPLVHLEFDPAELDDHRFELHGDAQVRDGALVISGEGHAITPPLRSEIHEKTLAAWVTLHDLDQRGGGVVTLQTPDGSVFDSIVFAEKKQREWLPGSEHFARTQELSRPKEELTDEPVHIAIVYESNGRVAAYRNGEPYGNAYDSDGPRAFVAGQAVLAFGVRHTPAQTGRMFQGEIHSASLFDRAFSGEEIATLARTRGRAIVTEAKLLAALSGKEREIVELASSQIDALESRLEDLEPAVDPADNAAVFADLAAALFTFKEFIYVK